MGADQEPPIDLRLLLDVPGSAEVSVSRDALRDALEANRTQGSKRRLSTDAHIELALRHKRGEPATRLGRAYGISPGSVAQVVGRVERAAKRLWPTPPGKNAAPAAATSGTSSGTGQAAARVNDTPAQKADADPGSADARRNDATRPHRNDAPAERRDGAGDGQTTDGIMAGPFVREILDAIRPLAGPSHVSSAVLRRVAASLERLAGIMRRRADQADE
jgi:hypothetical protein